MFENAPAAISARKRPIEQKAKLIKNRGLKKADLELDFFFMWKFQCSPVATGKGWIWCDRLSPKRVPFALLVRPRSGDKINFSISVRIFIGIYRREKSADSPASARSGDKKGDQRRCAIRNVPASLINYQLCSVSAFTDSPRR